MRGGFDATSVSFFSYLQSLVLVGWQSSIHLRSALAPCISLCHIISRVISMVCTNGSTITFTPEIALTSFYRAPQGRRSSAACWLAATLESAAGTLVMTQP